MKKLNSLLFISLLFFTSFSKAAMQNVRYKSKDLNLNFEFPVNWSHPVSFSGFNAKNKEYKLAVTTTKKSKDLAQVSYDLFVNGEKTSGGSIVTQIGNSAKLSNRIDEQDSSAISFESTIAD